MLITKINSQNTQLHNPNFNGLWGKTTRETDKDSVMNVVTVTDTLYYYPFSDEKKEDIDNIINSNKNAYIDDKDGELKYKVIDCKLCYTLPIKEDSYIDYYCHEGNDKVTKKQKTIHKIVEKLYSDNVFGNEQQSAQNEIISQKLYLNA